MKFTSALLFLIIIISSIFASRQSSRPDIIGGPNGANPYLFKSVSSRGLLKSARNNQWSINFHNPQNDTINIIAIRVELKHDSSSLTTGNGLFGIYRTGGDKDEEKLYKNDTSYVFDKLPHDSSYFASQLDAVASYYKKVSRGALTLTYSIYPSGSGETGYAVDSTMTFYSPGGKRKKEAWNDYNYRKTHGLLLFVKEAIEAANKSTISPFKGVRFQKSDSTYRDSQNRKTVFLIFHAGASYLTDGGKNGYLGQDTPSDMIDIFVTPEFFKSFSDTLKLKQSGVVVQGIDSQFVLDEIMMCSETSNQDGLNWGIQGIIINQIARQIGIPDLHSTTGGISGIGSFCIMDFAGYSAGNGFIPPYPSAWVRAFMGWDKVKTVPIGSGSSYNVKALTLVLDSNSSVDDTTILMIPINDHEYYLIENRQRNLGIKDLFKYDTTEDKVKVIASYPYNVKLNLENIKTSGKSNVVMQAQNNDICLPASGLLVWHIDERIIRERIGRNWVNADSSYRGVSLVEADGASDLGVMFRDIFYQAAFDFGGAEDVFPHNRKIGKNGTITTINSMGPWSFPATRSNDGGHSYIKMNFAASSNVPPERMEKTMLFRGSNRVYIENFPDSVFKVSVSWDYQPSAWPKTAAPEPFFEPVLCNLDPQNKGKELVLIGKSGRIYIWSSDTSLPNGYVFDSTSINGKDFYSKTAGNAITYYFYDSLSGVNAMPSVSAGSIVIPSSDNLIYVLSSVSQTSPPHFDTIFIGATPSTYVCVASDSLWAIGCKNGSVVFGKGKNIQSTIKLPTDSIVCALSVIRESNTFAVIQKNGSLSICDPVKNHPDTTVQAPGIGPYTLVSGDLDSDSASEIVVCDIKHGLWMYEKTLKMADHWPEKPIEHWASVYTISDKNERIKDYSSLPDNPSSPALADINRDGMLDIIIGGTNGLYSLNYKGVLNGGWPAYLDTKYWNLKGSVISTPIIGTGKDKNPLVLFSTSTGDNLTYTISKITRADRNAGKIWYTTESGRTDSAWGLKPSLIDTFLIYDSLIYPYVLPGGFIDAVNVLAKRPLEIKGGYLQSIWPLSSGSPLQSSPMADDMDGNGVPDLFGVTQAGWVYRWELDKEFIQDSLYWPMPGFDAGRSFAYGNSLPQVVNTQTEPVKFYNFPNPTNGSSSTIFRYSFSGLAKNVRLDIFSVTGINVYSKKTMGSAPYELTGSFPDWNEHIVPLDKFGPGVYRCRLEATINGKKHVKYWKMAVVR